MVDECVKLMPDGFDAEARRKIIDELETRVVIKVGKPTRIVDDRGHVPWYVGERKANQNSFNDTSSCSGRIRAGRRPPLMRLTSPLMR